MDSFSPFNSLEDTIQTSDYNSKFDEFFKLMKKKNKECPEDDDCEEIRSPCCDVRIEVIFGSYPLKVKCSECENRYSLRDVIAL